ncbi:MAG: hypothetical protein JSS11_12290 [Verrucomicrobia bacterium]|nr:hypothetical protein [Verrucomicrobiota bacterium]
MFSDLWQKLRAWIKSHLDAMTEQHLDLLRFVAAGLLLTLLAGAGWLWGRPLWRRWQHGEALQQARQFSSHSDYQAAALALRRAIELAPNDPATWKAAAQLLSEIGSPEALLARQQVARLTPGDTAVKLALASEALRLDRLDIAQLTLAEINSAAQRDAAFYRLAAAVALATGRSDDLEVSLARVAELSPQDAVAKFNYAAVRLWSAAPAKVDAARQELETLTADPAVRVRAALELLKEAARQSDANRITKLMTLLLGRFAPGARPDFTSPGLPGWVALVEGMKDAAAQGGADDTALLARWLADIGQGREALLWLESLPAALAKAPAVADAGAELSAGIGDLDRLEERLRAGAWGQWPRSALTLAIAARLQRLYFSEASARATWADAVTACSDSPNGLRSLVRLASAWRDVDAAESALQTVIKQQPKNLWGYTALRDLYGTRQDLNKLWLLHGLWARQIPDDAEVALRWVTLACLLNHVTPEVVSRAEALQRDAAGATGPAIALASVRWRQGKPKDALALLRPLATNDAPPAVWLWFSLALADTGEVKTAQTALQQAWRKDLTSEETQLLRTAAAKVRWLPPN